MERAWTKHVGMPERAIWMVAGFAVAYVGVAILARVLPNKTPWQATDGVLVAGVVLTLSARYAVELLRGDKREIPD